MTIVVCKHCGHGAVMKGNLLFLCPCRKTHAQFKRGEHRLTSNAEAVVIGVRNDSIGRALRVFTSRKARIEHGDELALVAWVYAKTDARVKREEA